MNDNGSGRSSRKKAAEPGCDRPFAQRPLKMFLYLRNPHLLRSHYLIPKYINSVFTLHDLITTPSIPDARRVDDGCWFKVAKGKPKNDVNLEYKNLRASAEISMLSVRLANSIDLRWGINSPNVSPRSLTLGN